MRGEIPQDLRLPARQALALHGELRAGILGLLLYPVSLLIVAATVLAALEGHWPEGLWQRGLLVLNAGNLIAVFTAAVVSSLRGLSQAGALRLAWHIPLLPIYWALMSLAAWQALRRFYVRPTEWEKTRHGVAQDRRTPGTSGTPR